MEIGSYADWFAGTMSALAVMVALGGYGFSEWQRRHEKKSAERKAGRQIGLKLMNVLNRTHDIHRHIWADYSGPPLGGDGSNELWRTIQPLIGLTDDPAVALDGAETNLLIEADETEFLMEITLATSRYQSIVASMKEYQLRYEAVYQMSPAPTEMEGNVGVHRLTREQYLAIRPYTISLEALIQSLRAMTAENVDKCQQLAEEYTPMMKRYFKGEKFLSLTGPVEPAEVQATD